MATETTAQYIARTTSDTFALVDGYKRRPLDNAREALAVLEPFANYDKMNSFLTAHGSPFAGSQDPGIVQAAFLGHVQAVLTDLARAYENEITHDA